MSEGMFEITDFSYMDQPERQWCEELQAKMIELESTKETWTADELWLAAATALGNQDERYCRIYICENCGYLYHGDYSTNQDPSHDYCSGACWVEANPEAKEEE